MPAVVTPAEAPKKSNFDAAATWADLVAPDYRSRAAEISREVHELLQSTTKMLALNRGPYHENPGYGTPRRLEFLLLLSGIPAYLSFEEARCALSKNDALSWRLAAQQIPNPHEIDGSLSRFPDALSKKICQEFAPMCEAIGDQCAQLISGSTNNYYRDLAVRAFEVAENLLTFMGQDRRFCEYQRVQRKLASLPAALPS